MNTLTKALLGSVAIGALTTVPAAAGNGPAFHVQAAHAGRVVNKTDVRRVCGSPVVCLTYTVGVSTAVAASDFHKTVPLVLTFYKWNTTGDACSSPKERLKTPKKSLYGKIHGATETYSLGCSSGPTVFYGDSYKLTDKAGFGQTDTFVSTLKSQWQKGRTEYKGTLHLDVSVAIGN